MSDMPQIYVHIGLPKTATTTLQTQAFQHHNGWEYLGTRTPRMLNADPTFKVLEAFVQRGEERCRRHRGPGRPIGTGRQALDGQRGKFQPWGVSGLSEWPPFSETRSAKWARLAQAMEPFEASRWSA